MSQQFTVQPRDASALSTKKLRRSGVLPMALVERTHKTTLIQAPVEALREAMRHADGLGRLNIKIEGEKTIRKAIVRSVDHDPLKHELIHVTLQEVADSDEVKIDIQVIGTGHPIAMDSEDLILFQETDHIKIKGQMKHLPDHIEVDVTNLVSGGHINASDLVLPKGVELLSSADATIFNLKPSAAAISDAELEPAQSESDSVVSDEAAPSE